MHLRGVVSAPEWDSLSPPLFTPAPGIGRALMTPDLYLLKLLVGAIDNSWSIHDEDTQGPGRRGYSGLTPYL